MSALDAPRVAWIESAEEQIAALLAWFGPQRGWTVVEQRLVKDRGGAAAERAVVDAGGQRHELEFREVRPQAILVDVVEDPAQSPGAAVEHVMQRALRFAAENPPHHPGSLPRFPVPIEHYRRAVGVVMPVLAMDDSGRRGLYAPPRMAVVTWPEGKPVGVREMPGFDPAIWPPPRLGDWPSPAMARTDRAVLDACVLRFGACWSRVINAWLAQETPPWLPADVTEALRLRQRLDLPGMETIYRELNPRFTTWLENAIG